MLSPQVRSYAQAVEEEVQQIYLALFPEADSCFVGRSFSWTLDCFEGRFRDYQPIDLAYHDLTHTLEVTECMVRLLQGRQQAKVAPLLTQRWYELGLVAILLHDTGYLKTRDDRNGTGAKYTHTHVWRSMSFADMLLQDNGFSSTEIQAVKNMIRCTGVEAAVHSIPFQDDLERILGQALGTADFLGQIAASDYVDKLPVLYQEFAEASRFTGKPIFFSSAEDLIRKTPAFWEKYVLPKIKGEYAGLYQFLDRPEGGNPYLEQIERNLARIRSLPA